MANAAHALEASALGTVMRESAWAYPVANVAHLFGLAMLAGAIGIIDVRLLGAWRSFPLARLSDALTPVAITGLILFGLSGFAMFSSEAATLITSWVYVAKMGVIALAIGNAVLFRRMARGQWPAWEGTVPRSARALAALSLLLWSVAIILGRMIAYL